MPSEPQTWGVERLLDSALGRTALLSTASVRDLTGAWPFACIESVDDLGDGIDTVVVVGGGTLIDEVKAWRALRSPDTFLIAIPSIWGSGAECSPIVVLDRDGGKEIHMGPRFLPDVRCLWPELAERLPQRLARYACGDAWSHALEGFLSPLADDQLREELAAVIGTMVRLPIANDGRWFEPSGEACAGQARSSVGLVHGIAHTLEPALRAAQPVVGWGHARLCATFAWPVMRYNQSRGDKWHTRLGDYDLDEAAILDRLESIFDAGDYNAALPMLESRWMDVLRDPCTRTNCTLVRPDARAFFTERAFA